MNKIDLKDKTLTQYLRLFGFSWDILEVNKLVSNRTYYRWLNWETKPNKEKVKAVSLFLKVKEKVFLMLLENDIKDREEQNKNKEKNKKEKK